MPEEITVRAEAADSLIAARLVDAMVTEMDELYAQGPGRGVGSGASPSDFSPPTGAFLVIYADGKPVAGGGLKRDEDGVAEIKRMYVVPEFRGRGVARALIAALEVNARELGHEVMRLDSTWATWPIYEAAGYRPVRDYNDNPHADIWGEKQL